MIENTSDNQENKDNAARNTDKQQKTKGPRIIRYRIVYALRAFGIKFMSILSNVEGGAWQDLQQAFKHIRLKKVFISLSFIILFLYILSGVYTVQPGEVAVVRLLGKIKNQAVTEGIHYRAPWPFGRYDRVNIAEVRRETIGLEKVEPDHPAHFEGPSKIQVLTGDTNIIDYVVVVQYRVKDPTNYLFTTSAAPYQIVRDAVRASVTKESSSFSVDDILTTKRQIIPTEIKADLQATLDSYSSGILVVSVNFQKSYPPDEVADAFLDVQSAKEDKERMINQAIGYQNSILPEARGTAARTKIDAEAFSKSSIDTANGASAFFNRVLSQYLADKRVYGEDITRFRLYLETMEKVMGRVKTYVVDKNEKIDLRMVDDLQKPKDGSKGTEIQ